ncbi:hypothetical protein [Acidianus brierleyi]|uniref:Uncharacterized protein n=1 Tax=Acidianus brierleyi TaxID=41673 RepID=A0A2U9IB79_9CREN|nr:hypothetical protein [Acidianus brierleyi]AWR93265.1 hypothetical protein DFR85_00195 [Acidianus brierleyi]
MKITQICSCSILTILGIFLLLSGIIGGISYFRYSPDVPIYLGILLLSLATISISISIANRQNEW